MKTTTTVRAASACLLSSLLLAAGGCEPPDLSPPGAYGDPFPAPINDPQISVFPPELRQYLGFRPAAVRRADTGVLEVELPVRNLAQEPYLVEYRILFFDGEGFELSPPMEWTFIPIDEKQTVRLTGNSMDDRAQNYRVEVRWSR